MLYFMSNACTTCVKHEHVLKTIATRKGYIHYIAQKLRSSEASIIREDGYLVPGVAIIHLL